MSDPQATIERAPAKINLTLHVTGRRADGYHLLDSLVVFVGVFDRITAAAAPERSLTVRGPRATGVPADGSNLVWRAAELAAPEVPVALTLDKRLPSAAGIGGGSADAAAVLRLLKRSFGVALPDQAGQLQLGADVPVCMRRRPQRMRGIGEDLTLVGSVPSLWLVLINPGVELATPAVFKALEQRDNPPMDKTLPAWPDAEAFLGWLEQQRNDLQGPALGLTEALQPVLSALEAQDGCALARMSGSGATCFGVFGSEGAARLAATSLRQRHRSWWVAAGAILGTESPG